MIPRFPIVYQFRNLAASPASSAGFTSSFPVQKIDVPVRRLLATNMVFNYVIGIPARSPEEALPAYRLQQLDSLIAAQYKIRAKGRGETPPPPVHPTQQHELLAVIGERLRRADPQRQTFLAGLFLESGSLINKFA